jgi:hypothetical protein
MPGSKKISSGDEISNLSPNFVTIQVITFGDEKNYQTVQVLPSGSNEKEKDNLLKGDFI